MLSYFQLAEKICGTSGDKKRCIELLGGEAEFEVTHDRPRHFRVSAGHTTAEAWRHGRLLVNFVPLKQAIAEINRYRLGQIRLPDDNLGEKEVNIAVDIQHIDAWLEALERNMGVKVERLGDGFCWGFEGNYQWTLQFCVGLL